MEQLASFVPCNDQRCQHHRDRHVRAHFGHQGHAQQQAESKRLQPARLARSKQPAFDVADRKQQNAGQQHLGQGIVVHRGGHGDVHRQKGHEGRRRQAQR